MISKRKNTQWAAVLWEKRSSWSQWSEERGQVASRWQEDNINSKNHWLQLRYAEEHLLMHNMPNLEADGYSNRRQNMVQEQETKAAIKTKIGQKIEKKKNIACADESAFLLRHSDSRVRILCQKAAAGGVRRKIFSWHTLGLIVLTENHLNTTADTQHFHLLMAPSHQTHIFLDYFLKHDNGFTECKWPPHSPHLQTNRCCRTGYLHYGCAAEKERKKGSPLEY